MINTVMHRDRRDAGLDPAASIRLGSLGLLVWMLAVGVSAASQDAKGPDSLKRFSQSVESLVQKVSPSVVQIVVTGYGPLEDAGRDETDVVIGRQRSLGSGVIIDPDGYIVTNAHVVAGATTVRLASGDKLVDAVPVFIDPELDVALLYAPGLTAPALTFADQDPSRGATGATFGFPGGRSLVVVPAAVAGSYPATGRDIYGRTKVTRQILELRARIDQGDSGGPLVLSDGTVGGVVFAEARTDEDVGYALTPTAVHDAIEQAVGRTGLAPTGECIH